MKLAEHLKVRTPLIWVQSDEPRRVINKVAAIEEDRKVFRMDVVDGLVVWERNKERWLKVLAELAPDQFVPTNEFNAALWHCYKERGVMLIENAHLSAEALIGFLGFISRNYVDAFYADDFDMIPATFVLISCKDEIPAEIARDIVRVRFELPDAEEIAEIVHFIDESTNKELVNEDITRHVRAGLGMSEFEFAQACALSLDEHKKLEPQVINAIKLENLKAGGLLEMRTPAIKMADIGGLDQAKELLQRVGWTWKHPAEAAKFGLEPLRRLLLVGVPGSGKSAICEAAADALQLELAKFGASQMMSKWVGESEANMRRAFAQVRAMKPLTLWIDEFGRDMSGGQSSGSVDGGTTDRVHGEFLQGIQELPDEVFLVCAANRIDGLPPEMLRADRFDKIMFVGFPTHSERAEIFGIHLGEFAEEYDLDQLAQLTPYFTGAEIKALIKEVRFRIAGDHHRMPTTEDLAAFAPKMKGRVWVNRREQILEMYGRAKSEWDWASSEQEEEADRVLASGRGQAGVKPAPQAKTKLDNVFGAALGGAQ